MSQPEQALHGFRQRYDLRERCLFGADRRRPVRASHGGRTPRSLEPRDQPDDERAIPLLVTPELVARLVRWRGTANVLILAALLLIAEDILGTDIALQLTHP